jgi:hypothetical protein
MLKSPKSLKDLCFSKIINKNIFYKRGKLTVDLEEQLDKKRLKRLGPPKLFWEGYKNLATALLILKNKELYEKLGQYIQESVSNKENYGDDPKEIMRRALDSGEYLVGLGKAHKKAAEYILEQPKLKKRLSKQQQNLLKAVFDLQPVGYPRLSSRA